MHGITFMPCVLGTNGDDGWLTRRWAHADNSAGLSMLVCPWGSHPLQDGHSVSLTMQRQQPLCHRHPVLSLTKLFLENFQYGALSSMMYGALVIILTRRSYNGCKVSSELGAT